MSFSPSSLLLAHHGTDGARLAEALAFDIAGAGQVRLVHLLVVPDFWAGMQGDDWLNNASTRDVFGRYVERMLEDEAAGHLRAIDARCAELGIAYKSVMRFGDPTECVASVAREEAVEAVVIGPPRPRGVTGFRSRVKLEQLVRELHCPLLVAARK